MPELFDDRGASIVLINSEQGEELFKQIEVFVRAHSVDIQQVETTNSALIKSAKHNKKRKPFFDMYENDILRTLQKMTKSSMIVRLKWKIKTMIKSM